MKQVLVPIACRSSGISTMQSRVRARTGANETEYLLNTDLFEHVDQNTGYCL